MKQPTEIMNLAYVYLNLSDEASNMANKHINDDLFDYFAIQAKHYMEMCNLLKWVQD